MIQDATNDVESLPITEPVAVSPESVAAFLRQNADFFLHHPDILPGMSLPVNEDGTVSLAQRQTSLLREGNRELQERLQALLANAQSNDLLFEKSRRLSLGLMRVESELELNQALASELKLAFGADHLNCFLERDFEGTMGMLSWCKQLPLAESLKLPIDTTKACCITLRANELDQLFPNRSSRGDGSAALVGLPNSNGMLALGSDDSRQFNDNGGTLFVDFVGELIDVTIQRVVEPKQP